MTEKKDGGPAFPVNILWKKDTEEYSGMSLRDYFAGQIMPIIVDHGMDSSDELAKDIKGMAETAYWFANAMIKERSKDE